MTYTDVVCGKGKASRGARGDDPAFGQGLADQSGQNGEQRVVRPARLGRGDLSTQNRELVPKAAEDRDIRNSHAKIRVPMR
ncbi:hypothetical protein [Streptomyces sp. S465]|uniref:hypothetical protein n=1 Tax=Streptomyces sp. S465 TaxID=2979468 RepID=UPI0022A86984|nr:hypothetical protein [Streptomyces sp. S465]WAP55043.1 hypothetical protein N6H00_08620 [Streptomyces sp. S465]